jgi:autotransporter-associated beta strand protein
VTLPAGNTLTLGASGIDMAAATQNLSIEGNALLEKSQSWKVASGRTLLRSGGTTTFNIGTTTTLSGTGTVEFAGTQNLSGSGALVIDGGILLNNLVGGTIDRNGDTTLNAGLIKIQTGVNLFGNGTLRLNGGAIGSGNTTARTVSNRLAISGSPAIGGGGLGAGLMTFSGNVDLSGGNRTLTSNLATGLGAHFSGTVLNGSLVKAGDGILTLSGSNVFTGSTVIDAGSLAIGLNGISRSGEVALSGSAARLFIGVNGTTTVNNLSGVSLANIRSDFTISGGTGARTLAVNQTATGTYAGTFIEGGSRPISLTKNGSATLEMSGNSSYTGATRVNQGVLKITGSLGSTAVTVANAASLAGNGNLGGSLTIQSGGIHSLDVAVTPASQVTRTINGTLNLDSGNVLNLTFNVIPQNGTYILASATGGIIGRPGTVNLPSGMLGAVAVNGNRLELIIGDGFATWISGITFAPGADTSATGDPDRDGLNNFTEYAFGLAPNSSASVSPISAPPNRTSGTLSYTRRSNSLSGLIYTYESSATLTGAWLPFTQISETSNSATPVETITVGLPATLLAKPALFIRVKAVK